MIFSDVSRGRSEWVAEDGMHYTLQRSHGPGYPWELIIGSAATGGTVKAQTKTVLRQIALAYDANVWAARWPEIGRLARAIRFVRELDQSAAEAIEWHREARAG